MTSGEESLSGGEGRPRRRGRYFYPWLLVGAGAVTQATVNALSHVADRARVGRPVPSWEPWAWEATSVAAWLLITPLIFAAVDRWWAPRLRWPRVVALHLAFSIAISAMHILLMVAGRHLVYGIAGSDYSFSLGDEFLYEYRKDLITYVLIVGCFLIFQRLQRTTARHDGRFRLKVRDGTRTSWIDPAELDWAQAAGNYVELFGPFGTILHRQTLAALAEELRPHGFARIQRSRIVRREAITSIQTRPSGDFDVTLASGVTIGGSRRYRDELRARA